MTYLYILYSLKKGKYYIGQTKDLVIRLEAHNAGNKPTYTSKYRPWVLVLSLKFPSRRGAMKAEKYLKKKSREFLRRVIEEEELQEYIITKFS